MAVVPVSDTRIWKYTNSLSLLSCSWHTTWKFFVKIHYFVEEEWGVNKGKFICRLRTEDPQRWVSGNSYRIKGINRYAAVVRGKIGMEKSAQNCIVKIENGMKVILTCLESSWIFFMLVMGLWYNTMTHSFSSLFDTFAFYDLNAVERFY